MQIKIDSVADLGAVVRATRKDADVRLDDLASVVSMSKQFVNDVELGKPGVRLGKVLTLLSELGVELYVDVPDSVGKGLPSARGQIERTNQRRIVNLQGKASIRFSASGTLSVSKPEAKEKP
jgi:transcriptional regulator with XRE-family HTH domain